MTTHRIPRLGVLASDLFFLPVAVCSCAASYSSASRFDRAHPPLPISASPASKFTKRASFGTLRAQGSPCTARRRSSSRSVLSLWPQSSAGRPSSTRAAALGSGGTLAAGRARSRNPEGSGSTGAGVNSQASRSPRRWDNLGAGMAQSPQLRHTRTGAWAGPTALSVEGLVTTTQICDLAGVRQDREKSAQALFRAEG